jgi:hypothetical protein
MTPNGIALKVTDKQGHESFPSYEAYGWDRVNEIIQNTLEIEHVARVDIVGINFKNHTISAVA